MLQPAEVISFGYGHGDPPHAHLTIDLREHFRDPHVTPELRKLTAEHQQVRDAVLRTPGITALIRGAVLAALAFSQGPAGGPVVLAFGCAGGRHRSAVVAAEVARHLTARDAPVTLTHRDITRPVITRP